jgi:hypothetical protein
MRKRAILLDLGCDRCPWRGIGIIFRKPSSHAPSSPPRERSDCVGLLPVIGWATRKQVHRTAGPALAVGMSADCRHHDQPPWTSMGMSSSTVIQLEHQH